MSANNTAADHSKPACYEIRVGGPLPDQCAPYGAIHQLEDLGLQLLDMREQRQ